MGIRLGFFCFCFLLFYKFWCLKIYIICWVQILILTIFERPLFIQINFRYLYIVCFLLFSIQNQDKIMHKHGFSSLIFAKASVIIVSIYLIPGSKEMQTIQLNGKVLVSLWQINAICVTWLMFINIKELFSIVPEILDLGKTIF